MEQRLDKQVPSARKPKGFILFEVILALSLFGVVAVALTVALDRISMAAIASQEEMQIMRNLQTRITEASKVPNMDLLIENPPGAFTDDRGVTYETVIEELELENMDGDLLPEMYRIAIIATWVRDGEKTETTAETLRYAPLYQSSR